jgi:hypothetical protein
MTSNSLPVRERAEQKGASGVKKFGKELRGEFMFDEKYLNLNHGETAICFSSAKCSLIYSYA